MNSTVPDDATPPPHSWKGMNPEERASARRKLLVESAIKTFADEGEAGLSIRGIAQHARLNTRYFYESFETVDQLLGAAFDELNQQLAETLVVNAAGVSDQFELIHLGILTVLEFIDGRPERASLLFSEGLSNPTLIRHRRKAQDLLIQLVRERPVVGGGAGPVDPDVVGPMFAGAMSELVLAWLRGDVDGAPNVLAQRAAERIQRIFE